MKKLYPGFIFIPSSGAVSRLRHYSSGRRGNPLRWLVLVFAMISVSAPFSSLGQKLQMSYSYFNLSRNNGGGTLQTGDTIEIHALAQVNATVKSFYYMDTVPTGTSYISNSMKLMTNEGIIFSGGGPFTDLTNDDRGVYNAGVKGIRVNLGTGYSNAQSGVGFGVTTGGGTVNPGSIPKFYGNTLFVLAYKLVVTAAYGDTIFPHGTYYFDTSSSGTKTSFHFAYPGIKVVQNQGLCVNALGASFSAESSFGSGNTQNRAAGAIVPGYTKINIGLNAPQDNYFSIVNNTSANGTTNNSGPYVPTINTNRVFSGYWDIIGDHTGAANTATGNLPAAAGKTGGYMLCVNAAYTTGEAYRDTIKNVCPNTYYEFSAWVRNICGYCGIDSNSNAEYKPGVLPNLTYAINDIDYYSTGNLPHDTIWHKRGFLYLTGPTETQFRITIKNNAAGGGGNDWVLDDIDLATCYPDLVNNPKDTATSCVGVSMTLSDTVKSYFNNYTNYCWQHSTDGINWTSTGNCGSKVPTLVNGDWQYTVDTTFKPVAADSGTYFRLIVATTSGNINNAQCAIGNSQRIFLKVFNVNCTLLNTQIVNFAGNVAAGKASLYWTADNEANLKEYQVEKSLDGVNFSLGGTVTAMNDPGNLGYTFLDPSPVATVEYYRLKMVSSTNTASQYSKIIALYNEAAAFNVSAVNPVTSNLKLGIFLPEDGSVTFHLFDVFGNRVSQKTLMLNKGNSNLVLDDMARLPVGIYFLGTTFKGHMIQNKLFKAN